MYASPKGKRAVVFRTSAESKRFKLGFVLRTATLLTTPEGILKMRTCWRNPGCSRIVKPEAIQVGTRG